MGRKKASPAADEPAAATEKSKEVKGAKRPRGKKSDGKAQASKKKKTADEEQPEVEEEQEQPTEHEEGEEEQPKKKRAKKAAAATKAKASGRGKGATQEEGGDAGDESKTKKGKAKGGGKGAKKQEEERDNNEEEKDNKPPPTKSRTATGRESAKNKVENEENRALADALYELADYVMKNDNKQKAISYTNAAKSVREAPAPIKTKDDAKKLTGVGKSVSEKIGQFFDEGKIDVLEEYRSGERGNGS